MVTLRKLRADGYIEQFWKTQPVPQNLPSSSSSSSTVTANPGTSTSTSTNTSANTGVIESGPSSGTLVELPASSSSSSAAGSTDGPIDPPKTPADVRQEPGVLPSGFEWSLIDVKNDEQVRFLLSFLPWPHFFPSPF